MLQLLFNAADMVVIDRFEGDAALAAVGAAAPMTYLITNLFIGLSVGANVLTARYYGAKRWQDLEETVHTAITISLIFGIGLIAVGVVLARPLLTLMATPADVLDGVAIATVMSQAVSAVLVLLCLMRSETVYQIKLSLCSPIWTLSPKLLRALSARISG